MSDQLPAPLQVRETLSDLLGREVNVQLGDPPGDESIPVVAIAGWLLICLSFHPATAPGLVSPSPKRS